MQWVLPVAKYITLRENSVTRENANGGAEDTISHDVRSMAHTYSLLLAQSKNNLQTHCLLEYHHVLYRFYARIWFALLLIAPAAESGLLKFLKVRFVWFQRYWPLSIHPFHFFKWESTPFFSTEKGAIECFLYIDDWLSPHAFSKSLMLLLHLNLLGVRGTPSMQS